MNDYIPNSGDDIDVQKERERAAAASGRTIDPLKEYAETILVEELQPIAAFYADVLFNEDDEPIKEKTKENYDTAISRWTEFMDSAGRHPACPSDRHATDFVKYLRGERGLSDATVELYLHHINRVFKYWIADEAYDHAASFNPIAKVLTERDFDGESKKEPPNIPEEELRSIVRGIKDWRERFVIVMQLKLGLRASELSQIRLDEINISDPELKQAFPELGTHPRVKKHENCVHIPNQKDREGNKSWERRTLSLDDETRWVLIQYLLVRPDDGQPWVLLSDQTHSRIKQAQGINRIWKKHFHPKWKREKDDVHKSVTSHFGRHFMSTWFENKEWSHNHIKYIRGDKFTDDRGDSEAMLTNYIHVYVEDIEERYLDEVIRFGIGPGAA